MSGMENADRGVSRRGQAVPSDKLRHESAIRGVDGPTALAKAAGISYSAAWRAWNGQRVTYPTLLAISVWRAQTAVQPDVAAFLGDSGEAA